MIEDVLYIVVEPAIGPNRQSEQTFQWFEGVRQLFTSWHTGLTHEDGHYREAAFERSFNF